jgi:hypothetical protein
MTTLSATALTAGLLSAPALAQVRLGPPDRIEIAADDMNRAQDGSYFMDGRVDDSATVDESENRNPPIDSEDVTDLERTTDTAAETVKDTLHRSTADNDSVYAPSSAAIVTSIAIDTKAVSAGDEAVGEVADILVDGAGDAQALVVDLEPQNGVHDKDVRIGFDSSNFTTDSGGNQVVRTAASKDQLDAMDEWTGEDSSLISLKNRIGIDVSLAGGDDTAVIRDFVLSSSGHVDYAILSEGGFLGMGNKLVAVPYGDLTFTDDGKASIALSKADLEAMTGFAYSAGS